MSRTCILRAIVVVLNLIDQWLQFRFPNTHTYMKNAANVTCVASATASRRIGNHNPYSYAYKTTQTKAQRSLGTARKWAMLVKRTEGHRLHEALQRRQRRRSFLQKQQLDTQRTQQQQQANAAVAAEVSQIQHDKMVRFAGKIKGACRILKTFL